MTQEIDYGNVDSMYATNDDLDEDCDVDDEDCDVDDEDDGGFHNIFGISKHIIAKEDDIADVRNVDEKRFLPLNVPDNVDINEMRMEYNIKQRRSQLQILAQIMLPLLHVRHGDPMDELFHKEEQTL